MHMERMSEENCAYSGSAVGNMRSEDATGSVYRQMAAHIQEYRLEIWTGNVPQERMPEVESHITNTPT